MARELIEGSVDRNIWNHFVLEQNGSFLQSFEWGEFQESVGRRVFRFFGEKSTLSAVEGSAVEGLSWRVQFIEYPLPMGKKYWYCPRGPIIKSEIRNPKSEIRNKFQIPNSKQIEEFIETIKKEAQKEKVMFFRICPEWPADIESEAKLEITGFKKLRYDIEPSQTLILDISKGEDELLAQMHAKWRYNIGLAQKKNVQIKIIGSGDLNFDNYFENFWRLMRQTAKRQKIRLHDKEYYKKQLNPPQSSFLKEKGPSFYRRGDGRNFESVLFVAEYQGKTIAANIINFFGPRATYLHGGSDNELRSLMAPHLLQWEQILEAKRGGCAEYDFWGINEQKWPGVTRFKRGFGGQEVRYSGAWDYPLDKKWYLIYKRVQKFRR